MSFTISDFLKDRINIPTQPAPFLTFYEVEIPGGTYLRYVDSLDPEASIPGEIEFDGKTWTSVEIERGNLDQNLEGAREQLVLSVLDPLRTAAFYLRSHGGLVGQKVRLWIATADHLSTPADALTARFEVISSFITDDPPAANLVLGHFNLYEARYPRVFYDRKKCLNPYQDRHVQGSLCIYPSNNFSERFQYNYALAGTNEEKAHRGGWRTQQALQAETFGANYPVTGDLKVTSRASSAAWADEGRYGPYLYRLISGDFDVYTVASPETSSRAGWEAGILIQDQTAAAIAPEPGEPPPPVPASSWLFAGVQDDGAGGRRLFVRETRANVSTVATVATTDTQIRVTRAGDTFTVYSRAAEGNSWTQRWQTASALSLGTEARVGVAIAASSEATSLFGAVFDFVWFLSGGLPSCRRDEEDCATHENALQFNGFREIPSDRGRY